MCRPSRAQARSAVLTALLVSALVVVTGGQSPDPIPRQSDLAEFPGSDKDVIRFAAFGDMGTGEQPQYEVAEQMVAVRQRFPFEFVLTLGDNLYGGQRPQDYARKFEIPYKALMDAGVKFYASLGNHDDPNQRFYKPFNMDGQRYYTFTKGPAQFFALDSNYVDRPQLGWLEKELAASSAKWKICYFHHPLYSSGGRHGSEIDLRNQLEPLFTKYGVQLVFSGHDHFYERIRPQQGVHYFVSGAGGQLRKGDIQRSPLTAAGFDADRSFMLIELDEDNLAFESISRTGAKVDSGTIERSGTRPSAETTHDEPAATVAAPPMR
jgi:Calcineurin-like phosphoesterase